MASRGRREQSLKRYILTGAPGGSTIVGGPLDDRFSLGPGNDVMTGAAGDDTAVFTTTLGATTPDDFGKWIDIAGAALAGVAAPVAAQQPRQLAL